VGRTPKPGAGHRNGLRPGETPFGPGDVTPGLAGQRRPAGTAKPRQYTPSDSKATWSSHDQAQSDAYTAGTRGEPKPDSDDPDVLAAHQAGFDEFNHSTHQADRAAINGDSGTIKISSDGAGLLLGALAYCLVINYVRYGWAGVTGWASAKFTNKVTLHGSAAAGLPTQTTPPVGQVLT
jgi:hypothetical protein